MPQSVYERFGKILFVIAFSFGVLYAIACIIDLEVKHPTIFKFNGILLHITGGIYLICHGNEKLGKRNILAFFLISVSISLIIELIWIQTGVLGAYQYTKLAGPKILGLVPFWLPMVWFNLMYVTRRFSDFIFRNIRLPHSTYTPILLAFFESLAVTVLDLAIDPIFVEKGLYNWTNGGEYLGIPLTNYLGWFIISFTSFMLYRIFEIYNPPKCEISGKLSENLDGSWYAITIVGFPVVLLSLGITLAAVVTLTATLPFFMVWILVISKYKKEQIIRNYKTLKSKIKI